MRAASLCLAALLCATAGAAPPRRAVGGARAPLLLADQKNSTRLSLAQRYEKEEEAGRTLLTRRVPRAAAVLACLSAAIYLRNALVGPHQPPSNTEVLAFSEVLAKAARRALGGGLSGALAGVAQVLTLMWLRTTMNYQYRHGTSTMDALRTLWAQGGLGRLYQGLPFAIVQSPISRFGDTAANTGVLALLAVSPLTLGERTACASAAAAAWRLAITPLDTLKTTLQVEGRAAYKQLVAKVRPHVHITFRVKHFMCSIVLHS